MVHKKMRLLHLNIIITCFMWKAYGVNTTEQRNWQSKTYFDVLNELAAKIQYANSPGYNSEDIEYLSETIFQELYNPLKRHVTRTYLASKMNTKDRCRISPKVDNSSALDDTTSHRLYQSFQSTYINQISSICINDTGRLLTSVLDLNPWAVQFFDATGKPGPALTKFHLNFVGNYDQCKAAIAKSTNTLSGFEGNYCIVSFLTEMAFLSVEIGACLPSSCSSEEISSLTTDIIEFLNLEPPVVGVNVQCLTAKTEVTAATRVAISILTFVGIMMILGTTCDILMMREATKMKNDLPPNSSHKDNQSSYESIADKEKNSRMATNIETSSLLGDAKGHPKVNHTWSQSRTVTKLLLAFSVYSNGKKLLDTYQAPGTLSAIHGIRFLSMTWVVLGHLYTGIISYTLNGLEEMSMLLQRWTFLPVVNGLVSVDTFFTLSGLLTSYLTLKEMMTRQTWKINWPMFYVHRIWRLTPPYMFSIVVILGLAQYMGSGPLWLNTEPADKEFCEKNWWTNLLYINNLVKYKETCFGHAWYLANDMQFFVISPFMLIPFYFSRLAGLFSSFLILVVSWTITGALSTSYDWPSTIITLKPVPGKAGQPEWMQDYYVVPWCRIGPFVIGIISGYVLALTKGKPFHMHWLVVALGWMTAFGSGLAIVYGIRGDVIGDNPSTTSAAAFYNTVSRSVWGACISWIIIACSAGYGGPINTLLSWSPFMVLGRLTYMSYLIHICVVSVFFENLGALFYANDTTIVIIFLGFLVFVNMAAFVCVLVLESPMIGIERAFLPKDRN